MSSKRLDGQSRRRAAWRQKANRGCRYVLLAAVCLAVATALTACGTSKRLRTEPVALNELNRCLKQHGVPNPEKTQAPSPQELAIPTLISARGARVPVGVDRATFEKALKDCDEGELQVAPAPITSQAMQKRIGALRLCLARNGYTLPAPNFPGPGPVLDTGKVDIESARWAATATGCGVTTELTPTALSACMGGAQALSGSAKTNPAFQRAYLQLAGCLKNRA
jgi:hypothetical protein